VICNGAPGELTAAAANLGARVVIRQCRRLRKSLWRAWARNLSKPNLYPNHVNAFTCFCDCLGNLAEEPLGLFGRVRIVFVRLAVRFLRSAGGRSLQLTAGTAMVACFVVTFAVFSYAESDVQVSFPTRTFTLPVRTQLLVNCHPCLVWRASPWSIWPGHIFSFCPWTLVIRWLLHALLGCGLLTFQALLWCLAHYPKSFVAALVLAIALFVRLAVVLFGNHDAMRAIVSLLMIMPLAYLCARLGIQQQRRGQWQIPAKAELLMEVVSRKLFHRKRPFATAAQAQLWMEWRRNAVAPLIALALDWSLSALCLSASLRSTTSCDHVAWSYIVCALLTLWAFTSGVLLARDASSKSLALSSFLATRPVTSGELACAKFKLAGQVTLAGWSFTAVALFFWFKFLARTRTCQ